MPISGSERFATEDLYVDYDFEEVMFAWDHRKQTVRRKFYGETSCAEVSWDNNLFYQACLWGDEITAEVFERGKPKP